MESYAGADWHKRVTQLAVLRDGQPPSQFRFLNDAPTVDGVLKKLPKGTKIAVEATDSFGGWMFHGRQEFINPRNNPHKIFRELP
jgi:hypothetical protein